MKNLTVDLLLLNVSNYAPDPIFPYAFVQVSALAHKYGLSTKRLDLFTVPRKRWNKEINNLLSQFSPRMIGITLRQVDSLIEREYLDDEMKKFLPAKETRMLIERLRKLSNAPIVVGGFGFSTYAKLLMPYLNPDFGIVGEPDHFFENFKELFKRNNLSSIHNLAYFNDKSEVYLNRREFYGPLQSTEYSHEMVDEILRFYKTEKGIVVPVEVLRGCPMRCYFCSEPDVKGHRLNARNLDVVMLDVEFLTVERGIRKIWFVASELNVTGPKLAIELATRMIELRKKSGIEDIKWFGYLLPKITDPEIVQLLADSGHAWSWNEVQSLDEQNLKDTKVPYKVDEALGFYKAVMKTQLKSSTHRGALSFFLGNAFATPSTIVKTLTRIETENLNGKIGHSVMVSGTRVFPSREARLPLNQGVITRYSAADKNVSAESLLRPTFYLPKSIGGPLGGPGETMVFFYHIAGNFVTHNLVGAQSKKILIYLRKAIAPENFWIYFKKYGSIETLPPTQKISPQAQEAFDNCLKLAKVPKSKAPNVLKLIYKKTNEETSHREMAFCLIWNIFCSQKCPRLNAIIEYLGFNGDPQKKLIGSFEVNRKLLIRYSSKRKLLDDIKHNFKVTETSFELFMVNALIISNNINFSSSYRKILCADFI